MGLTANVTSNLATVRRGSRVRNLLIKRISLRMRFFLALWLLFLVLVAAGIHGSSIAFAIERWSPGSRYSGYLLPKIARGIGGPEPLGGFALSSARFDRVDEWLKNTPPALSQVNHKPPFPVVNTNIGDGQNMLAWMPNTPVWHLTAIARPATWGYFFLGPQRGLAWAWWFPLFGCFTALTLLFGLILPGHGRLAAFGAFWFCLSAYTVCWSLWPAYVVFFGALLCLSLYHLLTSDNRRVIMISAIVAGLSVPGEIMFLYPAWLVTLGYLFCLILGGLVVQHVNAARRTRQVPEVESRAAWLPGRLAELSPGSLFTGLSRTRRDRIAALAIFAAVAAGLCCSFALTCWPAFKVMAGTVYPGHRHSSGGGYGLSDLFKGFYNLHTCYDIVPGLDNTSEAASFFYFFPAVLAGLLISARLRKKLSAVGWVLITYLVLMTIYGIVGVPQSFANLTLLSYVPSYRIDIGTGLASIILSMIAVAHGREVFQGSSGSPAPVKPALAALIATGLFLLSGAALSHRTFGSPSVPQLIMVSLVAGLVSYFMMQGEVRAFCCVLGIGVVATGALFNPLATSLDQIYNSDLAQQIARIDEESGNRPLWLCYGPGDTGELVTLMGGRSISGIQWPPQVGLWRDLDPERNFEEQYNRDAWVTLRYQESREPVTFTNPNPHALEVRISPDNKVLQARGARYILATGEAQGEIDRSRYPLVYKSSGGNFTVFAILQE